VDDVAGGGHGLSVDEPPLWWQTCGVEKRRPTYNLVAFKMSIGRAENVVMTTTALKSAVALGFGRSGIVDVIASMSSAMFYKSMTTYRDHRLWQDVYHVPYGEWLLYIKFQADIVTVFKIVSFKEKD
jgi:motility quorum-sensing regulator / GCU-specific mRNA interferase toxin